MMDSFVNENLNPYDNRVGDCTVRAISKALDQHWDTTYVGICLEGFILKDMPSGNNVWGDYLRHKGFIRKAIEKECPECRTVNDFCQQHPDGTYILGTGKHVIAVVDGQYYDTWISGEEKPIYFWIKRKD